VVVGNVLTLVGTYVSSFRIGFWSELEKLQAYDWAMREHLSASDNPVRRRPKPDFQSRP